VKLQEAENQIITRYQTFEEKPADTDLLVDAVSQHEEILGRRPELVAPDEDTVGEVENPESGELHISSPA
jgi:hypothetical protein